MFLKDLDRRLSKYLKGGQKCVKIVVDLLGRDREWLQTGLNVLGLQEQYSLITPGRALGQLYFEKFIKQRVGEGEGIQEEHVVFIDLGYASTRLTCLHFRHSASLCTATMKHSATSHIGIKHLDHHFIKYLLT